jgi:sporulation protein YlmC with PRC-barrel domain
MLKQGEWRGSKLTGLAVYNNNDERVGDINELIIAARTARLSLSCLALSGSWEWVSTMLPCHSAR